MENNNVHPMKIASMSSDFVDPVHRMVASHVVSKFYLPFVQRASLCKFINEFPRGLNKSKNRKITDILSF